MAIPKDTNEHSSAKYTNFSRKKIIQSNSHKTRGYDQMMTTFPQNSTDNNLFGHVTAKSIHLTKLREFHVFSALKFNSSAPHTKNLQLVEFQPTPPFAHS